MAPVRFELESGPLVAGGVGGSGTRVVANILQEFGFYLGADLNADARQSLVHLPVQTRPLVRALVGPTQPTLAGASARFWSARCGASVSTAADQELVRAIGAEHAEADPAPRFDRRPGDRRYRDAEWAARRMKSLAVAHRTAPRQSARLGVERAQQPRLSAVACRHVSRVCASCSCC